eukprot:415028_1
MAQAIQKLDELPEKAEPKDEEKQSEPSDSPLFSQFQLGPFTLSNRIAMPPISPMTRGRATEEHVPTEMMATYYSQRSDSLLITEGTGISAQGMGWYRAPGIWTNDQIESWTKVMDAACAQKERDHLLNGCLAYLGG